MFWGIATSVDILAIALFVTLYFGNNSVLNLLWDATYSVWYFVAGGAILGLSFGYSISKRKTYKLKSPRRARGGYSPLEYRTYRPLSTGTEGKKWKTS